MMGMKLLERSDRYLKTFKFATEINQLMIDIMSYENRIDILKQAEGLELKEDCNLIKFCMDRVKSLIDDLQVLIVELDSSNCHSYGQSPSRSSFNDSHVNDVVRLSSEGLDGIEMSDDETDEMVKSLKFNKVECLSLRTKSVCVEDEHESA